MSTLGGGNGDGWPPEGGGQSGGLPGLPPEWGTIIIPDDPAELAREAAQVRRQMRWQARSASWRRRLGLPPRAAGEDASLGLPLLIMTIAVIATLTSLLVVAWPGSNRHPRPSADSPQQAATASAGTATASAATAGTASASAGTAGGVTALPNLALTDAGGKAVLIAQLAPAALLLVEDCTACDNLVSETVAAAPKDVTVLVIGRTAPTIAASVATIQRLADPQEHLRDALGLGMARGGLAAVVLVTSGGEIVTKLAEVESVDSFRAALATLR